MTANAPQTKKMLQGLQYTIFTECQISSASPFSEWSATDQGLFGNNPNGTITHAIYIGVPPEILPNYPYQCWITPTDDEVKWRTFGGIVYQTTEVYILMVAKLLAGQYNTQLTLMDMADALNPVIAKHAEQPNAPTVNDARWGPPSNIRTNGYFLNEWIGREWMCYGQTRMMRQQWNAQGGVQP